MPQLNTSATMSISIHAPLTRCDHSLSTGMKHFLQFQSTHLLRGATTSSTIELSGLEHFNPRTSYEVRQCKYIVTLQYYCHFNPRTSYEVRLRSVSALF